MKDSLANLLYENGISDYGYDFLESIKALKYHSLDADASLIINVVNSSPYFQQLIFNNTRDIGLSDITSLEELDAECPAELNALMNIFSKRRSYRNFAENSITLKMLAALLKTAYHTYYQDNQKKRNIPSGGGLFPVELYYINLSVPELKPGVYYYNPDHLLLESVRYFEPGDNLLDEIFHVKYRTDMEYKNITGYIVLTGMLNRACFKYKDKGIKWAFLDAGGIIQNIYLTCGILDIGCCANGGYLDNELAKLLGLKGKAQVTISVIAIGSKSSEVNNEPDVNDTQS